jgi:hypothetical protein
MLDPVFPPHTQCCTHFCTYLLTRTQPRHPMSSGLNVETEKAKLQTLIDHKEKVCVRVCVYHDVRADESLCARARAHTHTHTHTTYMHEHTCMHTYMRTCIYHAHTHTFTYSTHTHTHAHTTHTHTHTHTRFHPESA